MSHKEEKYNLRKQIRERQKTLSAKEILDSNEAIFHQILELKEFQEARVILCFVSTSTEINTIPLILDALSMNKIVGVPKCMRDGIMEFYRIHHLGDLEEGMCKILEPKAGCRSIPPEDADFAIIPCMSCDRRGNRLGKGGGYYDRFLFGRPFKAAAICREVLLCRQIPVESWDIAVDMVITEKAAYRTNAKEK